MQMAADRKIVEIKKFSSHGNVTSHFCSLYIVSIYSLVHPFVKEPVLVFNTDTNNAEATGDESGVVA